MLIAIQCVDVIWTKQPSAIANLPRAFAWMEPDREDWRDISQSRYIACMQHLLLHESREFRPTRMKMAWARVREHSTVEELSLRCCGERGLGVGLLARPYGAQPAFEPIQQAMLLPPQAVGQLCVNGHYSSAGGRFFIERTFHICHAMDIAPDVFTLQAPRFVFDARVHLS